MHVVPDAVDGDPAGRVPTSTADRPDGSTTDDRPISPKCFEGYRSLESETSTTRPADDPAWLQDLDGTTERTGRAQHKEDPIERLRRSAACEPDARAASGSE